MADVATKKPAKRRSAWSVMRFVAEKLEACPEARELLRDLATSKPDGINAEDFDAAMALVSVTSVGGSLRDNLRILSVLLRHELPTLVGEKTKRDENGRRMHAIVDDKLIVVTKRPRGGRPTQHGMRKALANVFEIAETHAPDHAPKVVAYLLWLYGASSLVRTRADDTAASFTARLVRAAEKRRAEP